MKTVLLILVPLLSILSCCQSVINVVDDPFVEGPYAVNSSHFVQIINPFLDTNIDVYAPNEPGNFPVFYFITGFGGVMPAPAYSLFLTRIASHGIVVVGVWKLESPINSFNSTWFDATVDFVENRLETNLHLQGFTREMHLDYEHSFISGHSAGAHVPVAQFQAHCLNFIGMVLFSPVDGGDPFGILDIAVITPGEKVNFSVPTLQLVTGLDSIPSNLTGTACAPENLGGHRFFDSMNGPTWYINTTAYGHGDFLDPFFEYTLEITQFCLTNPETPKEPYISYVAGQTVAFMKGVLDPTNNCDYFDLLETKDILEIDTLMERDYNGWEKCVPSQCVLTS